MSLLYLFPNLPALLNQCAQLTQQTMNTSTYTDQQELRLTGQAADAKLGAVLRCNEQVFYMDGLHQWGDYAGKTLTVSGFLRIVRQEIADNQPISSQIQGDIFIVQSWKIVD